MGHLSEKVGVTGLMVRLARNPGVYYVFSAIFELCFIKNSINSQRSLFRPAFLKKLCEYGPLSLVKNVQHYAVKIRFYFLKASSLTKHISIDSEIY